MLDSSRDDWDESKNNMAAKKSMKESRGRKWSEDELKEFASVLADDRTEFALTLETLALKKSANVHIFEAIKKELDARLQAKTTTSSKKGKAKEIDTSVVKLRAKYKWHFAGLKFIFGAALTRVQCLPRVEPSPFFRKIYFFK